METFIEIAPAKDKEVCANCKHWMQWGVRTGDCLNENSPACGDDTNEDDTCKGFDPGLVEVGRKE